MRAIIAEGVAPEVHSALRPVADRLAAPGLSAVHPDTTVVFGTPDPLLLASIDGPLVGVPVDEPSREPGSALVAHSHALALLDVADLPRDVAGRPVVVLGLPPPEPTPTRRALDRGSGPRALSDAVEVAARLAQRATSPHGVTWIAAGGSAGLLRAVSAWRGGRAAVALPGVRRSPALTMADCPFPRNALEAIELTRLLLASPALVRVLAARGRRSSAPLLSHERVVDGLLEAAELADDLARRGHLPGAPLHGRTDQDVG